jgi:hypothetical protein
VIRKSENDEFRRSIEGICSKSQVNPKEFFDKVESPFLRMFCGRLRENPFLLKLDVGCYDWRDSERCEI